MVAAHSRSVIAASLAMLGVGRSSASSNTRTVAPAWVAMADSGARPCAKASICARVSELLESDTPCSTIPCEPAKIASVGFSIRGGNRRCQRASHSAASPRRPKSPSRPMPMSASRTLLPEAKSASTGFRIRSRTSERGDFWAAGSLKTGHSVRKSSARHLRYQRFQGLSGKDLLRDLCKTCRSPPIGICYSHAHPSDKEPLYQGLRR